MKAVRSIELGMDTMRKKAFKKLTDEEVRAKLHDVDVDRSFCVFEALRRGFSVQEIHDITTIDKWFITSLKTLQSLSCGLRTVNLRRRNTTLRRSTATLTGLSRSCRVRSLLTRA
ncbi:MAG: hypothetical protein ACLTZI_02895 [[Eubacterium] siraeum]